MTDPLDCDLFRRIQDRVAIVGLGHRPSAKDIGRPVADTAVEAIQLALDDAGLQAEDVDGMCMLEMETTHEVSIARRLGVEGLRWWSKISYGGGASCATVMHAAAAIASGLASTVVCHRARNRGAKTARPWAQERVLVRDDKALHTPWGLIRPVDVIGMWAHRHMHEYGTRREHFGNVAIAARKHAQRNPHALMRGRPLDMAAYLAARPIGHPLHLYDCCKRGEGGPFTEGGRLELGGALPVLTSGGGLSEAYVHGFNLILEGVRQIRGTSSNQVPGCGATLVTGASGVATSALVLRGE